MEPKDITLSDDNIKEYNDKVLPSINKIEPAYSVVARATTYNIKGGQNIEIGVYLTGLGIPDANKLVLIWSSPDIIDTSSKGIFTYCIKVVEKDLDNKKMIAPIAGTKFIEHNELNPYGITVFLNKGYFLPYPKFPIPKGDELLTPSIIAEGTPHGYAPVSISLKTSRKAKAGEYEINVVFTYRFKNVIKQSPDKVKFHISSWWDRNQWWIITAGTIIAFILLVLTVIFTVLDP